MNAVLIISEEGDSSTDWVIHWILALNGSATRINKEISICNITVEIGKSDIKFMYQGQPYSLSNFDAIWYRRGLVRINEVFADNCDLDVSIRPSTSISLDYLQSICIKLAS
jgi:hypothetical protein